MMLKNKFLVQFFTFYKKLYHCWNFIFFGKNFGFWQIFHKHFGKFLIFCLTYNIKKVYTKNIYTKTLMFGQNFDCHRNIVRLFDQILSHLDFLIHFSISGIRVNVFFGCNWFVSNREINVWLIFFPVSFSIDRAASCCVNPSSVRWLRIF